MAWLTSQNRQLGYKFLSENRMIQNAGVMTTTWRNMSGEITAVQKTAVRMMTVEQVEQWSGLSQATANAAGGECCYLYGNPDAGDIVFSPLTVKITKARNDDAGGWTVTRTITRESLIKPNGSVITGGTYTVPNVWNT